MSWLARHSNFIRRANLIRGAKHSLFNNNLFLVKELNWILNKCDLARKIESNRVCCQMRHPCPVHLAVVECHTKTQCCRLGSNAVLWCEPPYYFATDVSPR